MPEEMPKETPPLVLYHFVYICCRRRRHQFATSSPPTRQTIRQKMRAKREGEGGVCGQGGVCGYLVCLVCGHTGGTTWTASQKSQRKRNHFARHAGCARRAGRGSPVSGLIWSDPGFSHRSSRVRTLSPPLEWSTLAVFCAQSIRVRLPSMQLPVCPRAHAAAIAHMRIYVHMQYLCSTYSCIYIDT